MPRLLPGLLACACLAALAGCAQPAPARDSAPADTDAAMTDSDAPSPANLVLPRPKGPEDLVEARSGPHVFRFPVKYDYNQAGPFGDGSWMLKFLWPTLEAMPWRRGREEDVDRDSDEQYREIAVSVDYIDRIPIRTVPENYLGKYSDVPDPDNSFAFRDRQRDMHGLEHWAINFERVFAEMRRQHGEPRDIPAFQKDYFKDWFIARDPDGRMRTLIECLPMELEGDGIKVVDGRWGRDMSEPLATCSHSFAMQDFSISITLRYPRVALARWAQIEAHVEDFLRGHQIDSNNQGAAGS